MKQIIVFLLFFAGGLIAKAQPGSILVENGDFEIWDHPKPFVYVPRNWTTLDTFLTGYSTAEQSGDAYTGISALKLTPLRGSDPAKRRVSGAVLGTAQVNPITYSMEIGQSGQPLNYYKPSLLTGYYKYFPDTAAGDSAYLYFAYKSKDMSGNGTGGFIISAQEYRTLQPSSTYQRFDIAISNAYESISLDTLIIGIFYSSKDTSGTPAGYLLIDNIGTISVLSVSSTETESFKVYPNPATNSIHIKDAKPNSTFEITDLAGRMLRKGPVQNSRIDVSTLSTGLYFLRVSTKEESWVEKLQIQK